MGYSTMVALAKQGYHVVMLCRSLDRARDAQKTAIQESGNPNIVFYLMDLSSQASIRAVSAKLKADYPIIDVLINNAGVITIKRDETQDGFEKMLGVNHLGHFLLTNLLLPSLVNAPQGRIVIVASAAYKFGSRQFPDPEADVHFSTMRNYGRSKLANLLFMQALAEKLNGSRVTVNAMHPGAVATTLGINRETGFGKSVMSSLRPFFRTPEKGAETTIYLATAPEVSPASGLYYVDLKPETLKSFATDPVLINSLWQKSLRWTGLEDA